MTIPKTLTSVFIAVLVVAFSVTGCVRDNSKSLEDSVPTISVQGTGKVTVIPDEAIVRFGVTSDDKSLARAYKQNTDKMNDIIGRVDALGVEKKDVQTTNYSVRPIYARDSQGRQMPGKPVSFRVDQQIKVKIRDISKTSNVIDRVMDGGTNVFNGIQFSSGKMEDLKIKAKVKAAKEAKEKAGIIAEGLGVKRGKVIRVYGSSAAPYGVSKARMLNSMDMESAPRIEPGSIEVTATCNVVYEIVQ